MKLIIAVCVAGFLLGWFFQDVIEFIMHIALTTKWGA